MLLDIMKFLVPAGIAPGLPRKAASRLERLGYNTTVRGSEILAACGTRRAADQFIHTWSARGILVPAGWAAYHIPPERVVALAASARAPYHGRLVSWAATPPKVMGFPRRPGFLGPVLWQQTDLSVAHPGPVLPLASTDPRILPTVPQLQAFAVDLGWPMDELEILVGELGRVTARSIHLADASWILSLNQSPRIRAAGARLLQRLPSRERSRARDIRRLASFPALSPSRSRALLPMVGPPSQYRLAAPRWYMEPHLRSLQAEARRNPP